MGVGRIFSEGGNSDEIRFVNYETKRKMFLH